MECKINLYPNTISFQYKDQEEKSWGKRYDGLNVERKTYPFYEIFTNN